MGLRTPPSIPFPPFFREAELRFLVPEDLFLDPLEALHAARFLVAMKSSLAQNQGR